MNSEDTENRVRRTVAGFRPITWKKDGQFYFHQKELAVLVNDADIKVAHNKFIAECEARIKTYADHDLLDISPEPAAAATHSPQARATRSFWKEVRLSLTNFTLKLGIIVVVAAFTFQLVADRVQNIGIDPVSTARETLHRVAIGLDSQDETAQQFLENDLRTIAHALRPFIAELNRSPPTEKSLE